MKNIISFCAALVIINGIYFSASAQIPDGYQNGLKVINKQDLKKYITYLASDELKGRAFGTEENLTAARFIAKKFNEFGLIPYDDFVNPVKLRNPKSKQLKKSGGNSSPDSFDEYFQRFYLIESKLNESSSKLKLVKKSDPGFKSYLYNYGQDYIIDYSSNKNVELRGQLVFLGYGIDKQENGYNDYITDDGKAIDVRNKIVIMVDGFPQESDSSSFFNKSKNREIKNIKQKAKTAFENGALAVLVAQSPLKNLPLFGIKVENLARAFSRSEYDLPEIRSDEATPLIYISRDVVNDIFSRSGKKYSDLMKSIEQNLKPVSFELNDLSVEIEVVFDKKMVASQNVIGFMEGSDPVLKNEFVVIGAHYDHVGIGNFGAMNPKDKGKIHNGADDNASGTSGVIELAEAFSKVKPKRSIIFIGFSAEETGIHGSRHYAYQNPLKPINKTVGMVNLDMIGRNDTSLVWIGGIFYSSDLKNLVEEANSKIGFELLYNVGLLTFASDQGPFIRKEVPSILFFAGLHDDYHTPLDDADKVDFNKAEKITKLAYISSWMLANNSETPKYRALSRDEKMKLVQDSIERQKKYNLQEKNSKE
ncbi:MAG: M20/M25/M40 family metallo-hydrolase [Bacteroidota bacterium]